MPGSPTLLIHGGAWAIPTAMREDHERGIRAALTHGYALLESGAPALEAVEAALSLLEDDETFDAGRGAFLTRDGRVQLDALLMDGATLRAGGVACVERLCNPIRAARLVLERSPHVYFVGAGAEAFAAGHGMALVENLELVIPREVENLRAAQSNEQAGLPDTTFAGSASAIQAQCAGSLRVNHPHEPGHPERREGSASARETAPRPSGQDPAGHDTVGAVALDRHGNLAAGTSTGGTLNKAPGRVGDSSLIGCGCYADNDSAAVSLTGWGEPIMKLVLGKWAADRVEAGASPQAAADAAIARLHARLGGHGGIILLDCQGRAGLAHNTPAMAWGLAARDGQRVGLHAPSGL